MQEMNILLNKEFSLKFDVLVKLVELAKKANSSDEKLSLKFNELVKFIELTQEKNSSKKRKSEEDDNDTSPTKKLAKSEEEYYDDFNLGYIGEITFDLDSE